MTSQPSNLPASPVATPPAPQPHKPIDLSTLDPSNTQAVKQAIRRGFADGGRRPSAGAIDGLTNLVGLLASGRHYLAAVEDVGMSHAQIRFMRFGNASLDALLSASESIGEDVRRMQRREAAHSRAVDGVEDPVFNRLGEQVGIRRYYSDRLMEFLLKDDKPEVYAPAAAAKINVAVAVSFESIGVDRAAGLKSGVTIDAEAIPDSPDDPENATNPRPKGIGRRKDQ